MKLEELKKEIPYKWRVQSFSKFKASASCVAYIDARDVMDILDSVCGAESWQDDYKVVDGKMFGGIGIFIKDSWIWKWDTGTESDVEKDKGQVSDAFKRAAVKWGIGRFLYSLDIVYVRSSAKKEEGVYPYVVDDEGKKVWKVSEHINKIRKKYNGEFEPDTMTAPIFSKQLTESKGIFSKQNLTGLYKGQLKDKWGPDNEASLVKDRLSDSQHIIDGLREAYQKGKK